MYFHRYIFHMAIDSVVRGLYKVVNRSCFGSTCLSDGYRRWVEVNRGYVSVTNVCSTCHCDVVNSFKPCPISARTSHTLRMQ